MNREKPRARRRCGHRRYSVTLSVRDRVFLVSSLALFGVGVALVFWGFSDARSGGVTAPSAGPAAVVTLPRSVPGR